MADYIEGEYIANFPKIESMSDDDLLIVEDSEATKQATFAQIKGSIDSIKKITPYFGVAGSPDFYPSHDASTASILGSCILGIMILGDSGTWETEIPKMEDYDYLWVSLFIEYLDGINEWLTPIRLTDENAKEDIKSLQSAVDKNTEELIELKDSVEKLIDIIGNTDISDMGDGTITGAIDSVRYAHVAPDETEPDEEGDN